MDANSKQRIERFKEVHPELPLIVVDGPALLSLEQTIHFK
jgi:hypothetical protein